MTTTSDRAREDEPIDIVVATGNPGKLAELRDLLGGKYRILSARQVGAELPEETGETFEENAVLKARAVARQTGKITIADDSGLEVFALDGEPGVYTARYAGPMSTDAENRSKLLDALKDMKGSRRRATFVAVIAVAFSPDEIEIAEGRCDGLIAFHERGVGGFGYDSIFETVRGKTMAELEPAEKHAISHRGQAMKAATQLLGERLGVDLGVRKEADE